MKVDGRCHCGNITFEAEVDPTAIYLCHCTDCQGITGTAFRSNVRTDAEYFKLLSGTPNFYIKSAESGAKRHHAFCGKCGTPVFACAIENPSSYTLRIGTIKQRAAFTPQKQIWRRSALKWVDTLASVPALEKQ